ncbi:hypothetical protein J45TS6_28360 [Paenibacillus sp. J45TS6]|uniref:zinc dependent phospholipase C family protein n=1 Tax=Paenibacillus sp. J45TS6 TaxID=2807196 RepID=UPI001B165971|nr:zinc dependent phospholipase C family protein [Paenibacillus sp. J45TS6]GIP44377.1 hypothetical protein J45TS6_28360 [Paenibacillus sp. J45TS6]
MATWVTHFRIAERLIDLGVPVSKEEFLVGNIGPDCGLYHEGEGLIPPKTVTHYKMDGRQINADLFYSQYLLHHEKDIHTKKLSFYLGYYLHLVTDQEWSKHYQAKKSEPLYQNIMRTPEYWSLVKGDWYGIDFQYLKNNKDHIFWTTFQNIIDFPDYLDIFPNGQVGEQIRRITAFYLENTLANDHEFVYLTLSEVDQFVEHTVSRIMEILEGRIGTNLRRDEYDTIH